MEILSLKTIDATAEIVGRKIFEPFDLASEKTAAQWTVGDEADAKIAASGEDFIFRIARPK